MGREETPDAGGRAARWAGRAGVTLLELSVVIAIAAVLAAVTVPLLGRGHAVVSVVRAAERFAVAVRLAQAMAQDGDTRTRVHLEGRTGFTVEQAASTGWETRLSVATGTARCASNYPGDGVEFARDGRPLSLGSNVPRAGTFTFVCGSVERAVVLQLTGRVRIR